MVRIDMRATTRVELYLQKIREIIKTYEDIIQKRTYARKNQK